MPNLKIVLDPIQRQEYIDMLLKLDGLSHLTEDPKAAYCPISLTYTPDELKPYLRTRQDILKARVLAPVGITGYDPGDAPFSPDTNLTAQPNEVYVVDSGKIVSARFFVGHNLLPSTGQGDEMEKAKTYNRIAVILMDKNIRMSRMQPHRAIYLEYNNFQEQAEQFVPVFQMLQDYEPGMGFIGRLPVLIGFRKDNSPPIDLENAVYREFPELQYKYNGTIPIVRLKAENPELFYEHKS